jgi:hypothetical protein
MIAHPEDRQNLVRHPGTTTTAAGALRDWRIRCVGDAVVEHMLGPAQNRQFVRTEEGKSLARDESGGTSAFK